MGSTPPSAHPTSRTSSAETPISIFRFSSSLLRNNIMVCDSVIKEEKKGKSCCSSKKSATPDNSAIPQERELTPITKGEREQETGCQCCVKRVDTDPSAGYSQILARVLIVDVDDGRPQPVTTNFRCACGTFRGCCWGTCYPGCKCPGM